jgi:GTP-binding protein
VITDLDTGEIIVDLTDSKNVFIIAHGGKGGAGNSIFKNSTNQAPTYAQPGLEGQEKNLRLELKVIADVGLVGYPNAGKSTLISGMSNAKPETAPYPFTTITPHLGVVNMPEFKHFVIADIPGIIEGAHEGKGLGIKFLRHIERTSILLFMLDIFDLDPVESYKTLRSELKFHNKELLDKEFFVALNKIDSLDEEQTLLIKSDFAKRAKVPLKKIFLISALKKTGTEILKTKLLEVVEKEKLKLQSHQTNEINFNQEALE